MLALRSQVMEAAGARSGVEQPGQSIAGNSARRASCAARRQLEREDEPVSGVRIDASPGKPDFFDASPGKPDCFVTLVSHVVESPLGKY